MSIILIIVAMLFLGVTFMTLALCRSASMGDHQMMQAMQMRSAIELSNAITRPTPKRTQPVTASNTSS